MLTWLAVPGFALPALAYLWFIHHYAVNVIYGDQWDDVYLLGHSYSGSLGLGNLWAQHVQERMFFPNLLAVFLERTTNLNVLVEMYLSAGLLFVAIALLVIAHRRRSPSTWWLAYCPVAIMLLSFVQYQNTLWGFQVSWYMVIAALALTLFLLDRPEVGRLVLAAAMVVAVVGSFSAFQGLLIWPAGLVLLYHRGRSRSVVLAWIAVAVAAVIAYFYRFNFQAASLNRYQAFHDPLTAVKSFFVAIGDVVGTPIASSSQNNAVLLFGVVIFVVAVWVVVTCGVRRDPGGAAPIGVALICFGVLFAFFVATGIASFGEAGASASRLTTCDLLILVGCYMAIISRPVRLTRARRWRRLAQPAASVVILVAVCLQVGLGIGNGLAGGRMTKVTREGAADVLVNIDQATVPDVYVAFGWVPIPAGVSIKTGGFVAFVRSLVPIVTTHRLSEFATTEHVFYAKEGLLIPPSALGFVDPGSLPGEQVTGRAFTVDLQAFGAPTPTLSSPDLPPWLSLTDHPHGIATLAATSPPSGVTTVAIRASNRAGSIEQDFTFNVQDGHAPLFESRDRKTCEVGVPCTFPVRVQGWPTPKITEGGPLPEGMTLIQTLQGARLSGTVSGGPRTDTVVLHAVNGIGSPADQTFTITIR